MPPDLAVAFCDHARRGCLVLFYHRVYQQHGAGRDGMEVQASEYRGHPDHEPDRILLAEFAQALSDAGLVHLVVYQHCLLFCVSVPGRAAAADRFLLALDGGDGFRILYVYADERDRARSRDVLLRSGTIASHAELCTDPQRHHRKDSYARRDRGVHVRHVFFLSECELERRSWNFDGSVRADQDLYRVWNNRRVFLCREIYET